MKIIDVRYSVVYASRRRIFGRPVVTGLGTSLCSEYAFVEILTDEGVTGVGEMASVFERTGGALAMELGGTLTNLLVDKDPFQIAVINNALREAIPGCEPAMAGIDMALYDIVGKVLETPVYNLLGGLSRPRIPLSYSIPYGTPDEAAQFATECVADGFKTVKIKVGQSHERDVECVRRVREAVGPEVIVRVDANMALADVDAAVKFIRAIERYEPELVEQPLAPDKLREIASIRQAIDVPIMVDESIWSPASTLAVIRADAADVANIYVMESGGLTSARSNFQLAQAAGMQCMIGSMPELGVGTAAQIHLGAAMPNLDLASDCCGTLYHDEHFLTQALEIDAGFAYPSPTPGLGVTLDHDMIDRHRERPTNGDLTDG